jgi:carbon storage regulator
MLVLSRKQNEEITIGQSIRIMVVAIRDGQVRLGIEAPKEIPIHRREVRDAIERGAGPSKPQSPVPNPFPSRGVEDGNERKASDA